MWAAGTNYKKRNIGLIMEIYAIKQFDKLACSFREVSEKITNKSKFILEDDWKPRNHPEAPDVKALDDIEPQLVKVSLNDLS
jgi:hypothetical protein